MLRGWIQSKKAEVNASTHSLDALAEPQNCAAQSDDIVVAMADMFSYSGGSHASRNTHNE